MNKIFIDSKRYTIELALACIIGLVLGAWGHKVYVSIDKYLNEEPLGYLCKKGVTYIQADPLSTVYIKTENNLECAEEEQQ